jgi:adenosylcobinamide hydrolase
MLTDRPEADGRLPVSVLRLPAGTWTIASGPLGGGLGRRNWVINATVDTSYARIDPDAHLGEIAGGLGLSGAGVGLLTAVDVRTAVTASDGGVEVVATVGLGHPTWAAAPDGDVRESGPGTINVVALVPARLAAAALVNAVATVTEAKAQALWAYGADATGTASDALCIALVPPASGRSEPASLAVGGEMWEEPGPDSVEAFGGPRSTWGARLARATYAAVYEGARRWGAAHRGPSRS